MKDIDRNITSRLYKVFNRVANLHIIGGVLHPSSGGTGVTDLSRAYPYIVKDKLIKTISKTDIHLIKGYAFGSNFDLYITINEKSLYFEGNINIIKTDPNVIDRRFCYFTIQVGGYDLENIKIGVRNTQMTIKNNIVYLLCDFGDVNEISYSISTFVPII